MSALCWHRKFSPYSVRLFQLPFEKAFSHRVTTFVFDNYKPRLIDLVSDNLRSTLLGDRLEANDKQYSRLAPPARDDTFAKRCHETHIPHFSGPAIA